MKNLFILLLITVGTVMPQIVQAQAAKAPPRRPGASASPAAAPGTSARPATPPATPANKPATDYRNSSSVPAPITTTPTPVKQPVAAVPTRNSPAPKPGVGQLPTVGDVILNGGFGFPTGTTLVDINGEYVVSKNLGLGGTLLFSTSSGSATYLGLKANYHLGQVLEIKNSKLDPWVGGTLSRRMVDGAPLFFGAQLGFRYMYQRKMGVGTVYNLYFGNYSGLNHVGIYFTYKIHK